MDKIFYINFAKGCTIKVNANDNARKYFDKYFFGCVVDEINSNDYLFEITLKGNIDKENVIVPENSSFEHAFMGAKYNTWHDGQTVYAYANKNQKMGSHLVARNGSNIDVYLHDDVDEEIVMRMARECIFRYLISDGYVPMHASGVVTADDKVSLFFGNRNAGKTLSLCKEVVCDNGAPLSNDLIMAKCDDDGWNLYGWPIKVSFHKRMMDLFNFDLKVDDIPDNKKVKFTPKEFCELTNKSWIWNARHIDNVFYLNTNENQRYSKQRISKQQNNEVFNYLLDDNWHFGDFLMLGSTEFDYSKILENLEITEIKGNYVEHVKQRADKNRIM